jgi:hypothetical protein
MVLRTGTKTRMAMKLIIEALFLGQLGTLEIERGDRRPLELITTAFIEI